MKVLAKGLIFNFIILMSIYILYDFLIILSDHPFKSSILNILSNHPLYPSFLTILYIHPF